MGGDLKKTPPARHRDTKLGAAGEPYVVAFGGLEWFLVALGRLITLLDRLQATNYGKVIPTCVLCVLYLT